MQVLIIDDDVVSRMMLMHMVDGAGAHAILEAEDGEDAWSQLQGGARPALVFCDLRMPRLSGMELLARVRADSVLAGLPFVLVSAAGDAATMDQALGLGADDYIVKPFDSARVGACLARVGAGAAADGADADADVDEAPGLIMRRLGIDAARLQLYLGGLRRQLADAAAALPDGAAEDLRIQLARLGEGCAMLGLHAAAAALGTLAVQSVPAPHAVAPALDMAQAAVARHIAAARALA